MTTLTDCTISGNSAGGGGGLFNNGNGTMTIADCTISGNIANARHGGGLFDYGTAVLTNCTVSGNSASAGGGLYADNGGLTLTGSIVAGNVSLIPAAGPYSDIVSGGSSLTGSYNLIGIGGGGYFRDGVDGNIVLTSLVGLGLAPLGDYGGATQTMALLPGSPAIGVGTTPSGMTADQRGLPLDAPNPDIGAFQSQGFTLATMAGGTPQSATLGGDAFANPLAVTINPKNPNEPVAGGLVRFAVNASAGGAAATLSGSTATIGTDGVAQITATPNASAGTYIVTASTAGVSTPASFSLTNAQIGLTFTGPAAQSITYGTTSVTIAGTLSGGANVPQGETVAITLGNTTQQAAIDGGGAFSAAFDTADLPASESPYPITCVYTSDGTLASASTTSSLAVTKAATTLALTSSAGSTVYGQPVTLVAVVTAAVGPPGGTVTFFDGATALGEASLDGSGRATLDVSDLPIGSHSITANYGGASSFLGTTSGPTSESVSRDVTQIVLVPKGIFKKKKVVSVGLTATIEPLAPGGGTPTGTVTFKVKKKTLGNVSLAGGRATLTVKVASVLRKVITIVYTGDGDFNGSTATPPALARSSLAKTERPMARFPGRGPLHARGAVPFRAR